MFINIMTFTRMLFDFGVLLVVAAMREGVARLEGELKEVEASHLDDAHAKTAIRAYLS